MKVPNDKIKKIHAFLIIRVITEALEQVAEGPQGNYFLSFQKLERLILFELVEGRAKNIQINVYQPTPLLPNTDLFYHFILFDDVFFLLTKKYEIYNNFSSYYRYNIVIY